MLTKTCQRCGATIVKTVRCSHKKWERKKYCSQECVGKFVPTHGYSDHRLYKTWQSIKDRCYNPRKEHYQNYGGRGIKMCEQWLDDPKTFIDWALSQGAKPGLEIDRINNNGNYEPGNCRLVTKRQNLQNRRNVLVYKGETAPEASKRLGGNTMLVYTRVKNGWPVEEAFNRKVM